ncbi:MAG: hypothetical protein A3K19_13765 [Lentisphaerae bacterium RIFOXYB12_FULL_65_16]|nr:MAG: hypothetical protein A3K18_00070 [Lentisphaerae bacterium RIFOXYA12_64_32]OGV84216.1 MAG: hypothetical protein A3K19_13765 [Lentisphaerae bacterium RIFOXYB12_FULL_65_16]
MIAMAIFLLVVVALVGFSREVTKSWGRLQTEQARFQDLMALDRALDGILTNIVSFVWRDEDGQPQPAFLGESDQLTAACLRGCDDPHDGSLRFVGLAVDDHRLLAVYQHRPFLVWGEPSDMSRTSVLAEGVAEVRFSYAKGLEEGEIEWREQWDNDEDGFPVAIMVQVFWADGRQESWMRRISGDGYRERWGKWEPQSIGKQPQT